MKKILLVIIVLLSAFANANRLYSNIAMRYVWNHNHTEMAPQYITIYRNIGEYHARSWALLLNASGNVIANIELPDDITSINHITTTDSSSSCFILAGTGGLVSIDQDNNFHELPLLGYEVINVLKTQDNSKFQVVANRTESNRRDSVSFKISVDDGRLHDMGNDMIISNNTITSATSLIDIDKPNSTDFFATSGGFIYRKVGDGYWLRIETPSEYDSFNFLVHNDLSSLAVLLAYNTTDHKWYRTNFRGSTKRASDFLPVFHNEQTNVGLDYFSYAVSSSLLGDTIVSLNNSQDNLQTVVNYTSAERTMTFSDDLPPHGGSINLFHIPRFEMSRYGYRSHYSEFSPGVILFVVRNKVYVEDFDFTEYGFYGPRLLSNLPI